MKLTPVDKESKTVSKILCESGSIIFTSRIPFRFSSGLLSPVYVDNRKLISLPNERKKIVNIYIKLIKKLGKIDVIAGTATAGIPYAAFIAQSLNLPMVYVRSEAKMHGRKNQVEGTVKRGQRVVVIEDTVSTGKSSVISIRALRILGAKVDSVLAIYTHGLKVAEKNFRNEKVKLYTITNLKNVLDFAESSGYLKSENQTDSILDWARSPESWGKRKKFK